MNKKMLKKSKEELQNYLMFKRKGWAVEPKKGKGSKYKRNNKINFQED